MRVTPERLLVLLVLSSRTGVKTPRSVTFFWTTFPATNFFLDLISLYSFFFSNDILNYRNNGMSIVDGAGVLLVVLGSGSLWELSSKIMNGVSVA